MATSVTFIVAPEIAEDATTGVVLGEFNNWDMDNGISLVRQEDGSLRAIAALEPGRTYQYRYLLNDGRWVNDGHAQSYVPVHGLYIDNCVITVPEKAEEDILEIAAEETPVIDIKPAKAPKAKKASVKPAPKATKAEATVETKKAEAPIADDLTKIKGINKKVVVLLATAEIDSYKTLAKASAKKLKTLLADAGDKFAKMDASSWPKQAKLAAAGKWNELEEAQKG